jgi:hypothetical protein
LLWQLVAALLSACAFVLWPQPDHRITKKNGDLIAVGMTLAEVEAILGPRATIGRASDKHATSERTI